MTPEESIARRANNKRNRDSILEWVDRMQRGSSTLTDEEVEKASNLGYFVGPDGDLLRRRRVLDIYSDSYRKWFGPRRYTVDLVFEDGTAYVWERRTAGEASDLKGMLIRGLLLNAKPATYAA